VLVTVARGASSVIEGAPEIGINRDGTSGRENARVFRLTFIVP